jgi:vacuolar protein sorting-associated protein 16
VRHLVEKGHAKEAVNYVQRCDSNKRVDLYVECGEWVMAGKECKERGDRARLECVSFAFPAQLSDCRGVESYDHHVPIP